MTRRAFLLEEVIDTLFEGRPTVWREEVKEHVVEFALIHGGHLRSGSWQI